MNASWSSLGLRRKAPDELFARRYCILRHHAHPPTPRQLRRLLRFCNRNRRGGGAWSTGQPSPKFPRFRAPKGATARTLGAYAYTIKRTQQNLSANCHQARNKGFKPCMDNGYSVRNELWRALKLVRRERRKCNKFMETTPNENVRTTSSLASWIWDDFDIHNGQLDSLALTGANRIQLPAGESISSQFFRICHAKSEKVTQLSATLATR